MDTLVTLNQLLRMQHRVMHRCGHEAAHVINGFYAADCYRQAERLERQICPACSMEAKRAKAAADEAAVASIKLCPLIGRAKQISWAEAIRAKKLAAWGDQEPHAIQRLIDIDDAKWWIERRNDADEVLLAINLQMQHHDRSGDGPTVAAV
jgi:hypothetical protein